MPLCTLRFAVATLFTTLIAGAALAADRSGAAADAAADRLAHEVFGQLIGINTTDSAGNVTTAAEAMAQRFLAAGFPAADVVVAGPEERKKNLVVRLRGTGKHRPVLLIGHLDVVEARREDWSTDPFQLVEKDGYFYGRGVLDMKSGDAIMVAALLRLKQEGYRGSRDIILALTADEEGGCCNGVEWLVRNHRPLIDAEFALNHDGVVGYSITSDHGVPEQFALSATEKMYGDYQLTVTNRGGHSSLPRPDNAIYELAAALLNINRYTFPFELNDITRGYFERMATVGRGQTAADMRAITRTPPDGEAMARLARDPELNSMMRTTCGHPPRGGACEQCAGAARPGGGELPHPARALQGGSAPGAHARVERPRHHGALRGRRRCDFRHGSRATRAAPLTALAAGCRAPGENHGRDLAGASGRALHECQCDRRDLHPRRRYSHLWGRRHRGGSRRRTRARAR